MGQTDGVARAPAKVGRLATRIEPPRHRGNPTEPEYPEQYRSRGIEGEVVVRVVISALGSVDNADVIVSSNEPGFDFAARAAALHDGYEPARLNGVPVPYAMKHRYRFRLND
jgi:TonB family protein